MAELFWESGSPYLLSWLGRAQYCCDLMWALFRPCLSVVCLLWSFGAICVCMLCVSDNSAELLESFERRALAVVYSDFSSIALGTYLYFSFFNRDFGT